MREPWILLGITPTTDLTVIKHAYAKALKHNRPDDDAAAYQLLREAYDQAILYARSTRTTRNSNPNTCLTELAVEPFTATANDSKDEFNPNKPPSNPESTPPIDRLSSQGDSPPDVTILNPSPPPEDSIDIQAEITPPGKHSPTIDDVRSLLLAWSQDTADNDLGHTAEFERILHQLPLCLRDKVEAFCAQFVLAHPEASSRLTIILTNQFCWSQDFRLERLIGEQPALSLYRRIEIDYEALGKLSPSAYMTAKQRMERFLTSARLKTEGRNLLFWLRLFLSPHFHYAQSLHPSAKAILALENIYGTPIIKSAILVFYLYMTTLTLTLAWLQSDDGLFHDISLLGIATILVASGILSYIINRKIFYLLSATVSFLLNTDDVNHELNNLRNIRFPYWASAGVLFLVFCITQAPTVSDGIPRAALGSLSFLTSVIALFLLWPQDKTLGAVAIPLWLILCAVVSSAFDEMDAWISALPIATAWILIAIMIVVNDPDTGKNLLFSFFSALKPQTLAGWFYFFLLFMLVIAATGIALTLLCPAWVLAYARHTGLRMTWLALSAATFLFTSGMLGFSGLSFIFWLQVVLFTLTRMEKISSWLISRKLLSGA